jgi:hypothetical protein
VRETRGAPGGGEGDKTARPPEKMLEITGNAGYPRCTVRCPDTAARGKTRTHKKRKQQLICHAPFSEGRRGEKQKKKESKREGRKQHATPTTSIRMREEEEGGRKKKERERKRREKRNRKENKEGKKSEGKSEGFGQIVFQKFFIGAPPFGGHSVQTIRGWKPQTDAFVAMRRLTVLVFLFVSSVKCTLLGGV